MNVGELRSERASLATILTMVHTARRWLRSLDDTSLGNETAVVKISEALAVIEDEARALMTQVQAGHHHNPALAVVGNPPMRPARLRYDSRPIGPVQVRLIGAIASDVHQIKYRHAEDSAPYVHDFEHPGTIAWAAERLDAGQHTGERVILLANYDYPLWEDI